MKLRFLFCALLTIMSLITFTAQAEFLNPEDALLRAYNYSNQNNIFRKHAISNLNLKKAKCIYTGKAKIDYFSKAAFYVYNINESGFIIASADDRLRPLLAFSDETRFEPENMPENIKWWLNEYSSQIESILNSPKSLIDNSQLQADKNFGSTDLLEDGVKFKTTENRRKSISPMIQTKWNQTSPYSDYCPFVGSTRTATGCVATAMAQIMKYYNFGIGKGSHSYTTRTRGLVQTFNFETAKFDFDNMSNTYNAQSTYIQKDAVALLMRACGVSVDMDYNISSAGGSSAYTQDVAKALPQYFGYSDKSSCINRCNLPSEQWIEICYSILAQGYPLIYAGQGEKGGHAFVCDGYEEASGLFHINWGWGGISDGYYALDAMNPTSLGTGAGSGGYNSNQKIIIAVTPEQNGFTLPEGIDIPLLYANNYEVIDSEDSLIFNTEIWSASNDTIPRVDIGYNVYDKDSVLKLNESLFYWSNLAPNTGCKSTSLMNYKTFEKSKFKELGKGIYYFFYGYDINQQNNPSLLRANNGIGFRIVVKEEKVSATVFDGYEPGWEPDFDMQLVSINPGFGVIDKESDHIVTIENLGGEEYSTYQLYLCLCKTTSTSQIIKKKWQLGSNNAKWAPKARVRYKIISDYEGLEEGDYTLLLASNDGNSLSVLGESSLPFKLSKEDPESGITESFIEDISLFCNNGILIIKGIPTNETVELFDIHGKLLGRSISKDFITEIPLNSEIRGIYILRTQKFTYKIWL